MHRDIKPANIFFTVEGGDIQLGDLGLARMVAHPLSASPAAPHTSLTSQQTYTTNVGTPLYTAPEMMGGNYGPKTDMYSLGIILLELFMVFKTNCERNIVISNLKTNDDLDPELLHHWPLIARWIKRLIDKDPASRPTAQELLDSNLFPEPKPPPSPTTAITTIEETGAWGLGHHTTEAVAVTQSEFKSVNVVILVLPDFHTGSGIFVSTKLPQNVTLPLLHFYGKHFLVFWLGISTSDM
ncbi:Eukaryotic translation initiation factor 2-alpha kinase 1 [Chionoecetes opilio]|uniref:Eukaryotic translation initiation factor 2-alpha kinase 1 n=1 Tax=Chionoecetes opilio TaxID=41210 RepID=A0A8J4YT93_CHIOP|nr:Eukaryotic translation initiation factor 2-alpha kinase 1 [Chionoecetes opilio]